MPDIILTRTSYLQKGTTGQFLTGSGNPICLSLERPWKNNEPNVSCVPVGLYEMVIDTRNPGTEKACMVWELRGVVGRSEIQIHIGNQVSNSLGCILPATDLSVNAKDKLWGASSGRAFDKLMDHMLGKTKGKILITDGTYNHEPEPRAIKL